MTPVAPVLLSLDNLAQLLEDRPEFYAVAAFPQQCELFVGDFSYDDVWYRTELRGGVFCMHRESDGSLPMRPWSYRGPEVQFPVNRGAFVVLIGRKTVDTYRILCMERTAIGWQVYGGHLVQWLKDSLLTPEVGKLAGPEERYRKRSKKRAKRMRTLPLARKLWDEQNERYVSTRTQSAEALNNVVGLLLQHAEHREAVREDRLKYKREQRQRGDWPAQITQLSTAESRKWREAAENASTMAASYAVQLKEAKAEIERLRTVPRAMAGAKALALIGPLSNAAIDRLQAVYDASTPGTWVNDSGYRITNTEGECMWESKHFPASTGQDMEFCAVAHEWFPILVGIARLLVSDEVREAAGKQDPKPAPRGKLAWNPTTERWE